MRRRAFTLVEMIFSVLLVAMVFLGVWMIHTGGWRSMILTQRKLGAIRGAHLLFERLHRDLKAAHTLLIAQPVDPESGNQDWMVYLIDSHEYAWRKRTGELIVDGERWVLGVLDDFTLTQLPRGQVGVRISSLAEDAAQLGPVLNRGYSKNGRTVLEAAVTVDFLRGREVYPYVVTENRAYHGHCVAGPPIDF